MKNIVKLLAVLCTANLSVYTNADNLTPTVDPELVCEKSATSLALTIASYEFQGTVEVLDGGNNTVRLTARPSASLNYRVSSVNAPVKVTFISTQSQESSSFYVDHDCMVLPSP
ncbi:hypothetical protein [Vibrio sp. SCSIO 43136]|uniref:hypothetical protein n=1 Tax=Vibrio sp. SCSIO 43136 TaxID=2819101 RepID=UPI002076512B|nr:hypothetical protein [Vibrio sp. SCSIO 43136]USD67147.1 hypothetical protein J4N39_21155 [Vibrio sp. SCSIO 43136]